MSAEDILPKGSPARKGRAEQGWVTSPAMRKAAADVRERLEHAGRF